MPNMEDPKKFYFGVVKDELEAVRLFEGTRQGLVSRVQKRLSTSEQASITSGNIFVWDSKDSKITRWTDGKKWTGSRVFGPFLIYKEVDAVSKCKDSQLPKSSSTGNLISKNVRPEKQVEKVGGLRKLTYTIFTAEGAKLNLVAYYADNDIPQLPRACDDERVRDLSIPMEMYPDPSRFTYHSKRLTFSARWKNGYSFLVPSHPETRGFPVAQRAPPTPTLHLQGAEFLLQLQHERRHTKHSIAHLVHSTT